MVFILGSIEVDEDVDVQQTNWTMTSHPKSTRAGFICLAPEQLNSPGSYYVHGIIVADTRLFHVALVFLPLFRL